MGGPLTPYFLQNSKFENFEEIEKIEKFWGALDFSKKLVGPDFSWKNGWKAIFFEKLGPTDFFLIFNV